MEPSNQVLIEFVLSRNVLQFGNFTLKSGRKGSLFFNTGQLHQQTSQELSKRMIVVPHLTQQDLIDYTQNIHQKLVSCLSNIRKLYKQERIFGRWWTIYLNKTINQPLFHMHIVIRKPVLCRKHLDYFRI